MKISFGVENMFKNKPSTNRAQLFGKLFCIIIIINKSMEIFCKREQ